MANVQQNRNQLESDRTVLSKLIVRNHNQHGGTILFKRLKSLSKLLSMLLPDPINDILESSEKM